MSTIVGFDNDYAESQKIWADSAARWPFMGPPWRPSAGDVCIYRRFAATTGGGSILVLGATPELRDLAAELATGGNKPVVIDHSIDMLKAMSALTAAAQREREI